MKFIDGGVTAAKGFYANGVLSGIKKGRTKEDTALIYSEKRCNAAGVFTTNSVKAEPVKLSKERVCKGYAQAIIANSGNANACTGKQGMENAKRMTSCVTTALNKANKAIVDDEVLVCSTGVIGQQINVDVIDNHSDELVAGLSKENHIKARQAIMTTDTVYKEHAVEFELDGKTVHMGVMAKGSGMIHINMGTMLSFITTDCAISSKMLKKALDLTILETYNCVSVDGDTSTNDTLLILANGLAENKRITGKGKDFDVFMQALNQLNTLIAKELASDGEGASHLLECRITGAKDVKTARAIAKSVISSSLVKAAFFGKDANWGRILCAMGYSGQVFDAEKTSVWYISGEDKILVCDHGAMVDFDEEKAKVILTNKDIGILIELEDGKAEGVAWGCDLTYDYVKINGDYRT